VIVDDNFYTKEEDKFMHCGCETPQKLWMPLIEKAWAKSHRGYD
jgi:hypothetical protein